MTMAYTLNVWKPHIAQSLRCDQLEFAAGAAPSIDFRIGFLVISSSWVCLEMAHLPSSKLT